MYIDNHLINSSKTFFSYNGLFSLLFIIILCGFVTFTPDWEAYEYLLETGHGRDILFTYVFSKFGSGNVSYKNIHLIFISIYSYVLIFLIKKFTNSIFLISILFLIINYLYYTTQIRFFLGYFTFFLGFYLFVVENKKSTGLFFVSFSIASHLSIIILLPFIYFTIRKIALKRLLIYSIFFSFIFVPLLKFIYQFNIEDPRLQNYADGFRTSSLMGGLFNLIPFLFSVLLILNLNKTIFKLNPFIIYDKKYLYLLYCSVMPLLFFGISLSWPIITQRFIVPSIIFPIILFIYSRKYLKENKGFYTFILYIFILFYCLYRYLFPFFLFNEYGLFEKTINVLTSSIFVINE